MTCCLCPTWNPALHVMLHLLPSPSPHETLLSLSLGETLFWTILPVSSYFGPTNKTPSKPALSWRVFVTHQANQPQFFGWQVCCLWWAWPLCEQVTLLGPASRCYNRQIGREEQDRKGPQRISGDYQMTVMSLSGGLLRHYKVSGHNGGENSWQIRNILSLWATTSQ